MHDQLTLQHGQPACRPGRVPREGDGPVLRFGFTCRHVEALAWSAVWKHTPTLGLDASDRFEAAWGAIVECLFAAGQPVSALELFIAGSEGLRLLKRANEREKGYARRRGGGGRDPYAGPYSAGSFMRYWTRPVPETPEDTAVDRAALAQILARLGRGHVRVLLALAEHEDQQRAAAALGVKEATFRKELTRARAAFLALWHEHEAPSKPWGHDKRTGRRVHRSQPASPADAARTLTDARDACGGQARIAGTHLLARLAAADAGRYGTWDHWDLGWFLREHGIPSRNVVVSEGGRRRDTSGYWLEDITAAIAGLAAPAAHAPAA